MLCVCREKSASDRRGRLDRAHLEVSIRRQCEMLNVARSGAYRKLRPASYNDLATMRHFDALFTELPSLGPRRVAWTLSAEG